jgi:hypothetical protein
MDEGMDSSAEEEDVQTTTASGVAALSLGDEQAASNKTDLEINDYLAIIHEVVGHEILYDVNTGDHGKIVKALIGTSALHVDSVLVSVGLPLCTILAAIMFRPTIAQIIVFDDKECNVSCCSCSIAKVSLINVRCISYRFSKTVFISFSAHFHPGVSCQCKTWL